VLLTYILALFAKAEVVSDHIQRNPHKNILWF